METFDDQITHEGKEVEFINHENWFQIFLKCNLCGYLNFNQIFFFSIQVSNRETEMGRTELERQK